LVRVPTVLFNLWHDCLVHLYVYKRKISPLKHTTCPSHLVPEHIAATRSGLLPLRRALHVRVVGFHNSSICDPILQRGSKVFGESFCAATDFFSYSDAEDFFSNDDYFLSAAGIFNVMSSYFFSMTMARWLSDYSRAVHGT
jgi:hypothetical protein